MSLVRALGIFREVSHSPDREFDDYEILRLVGKELAQKDVRVTLIKPEELVVENSEILQATVDFVFAMCEQKKILELLQNSLVRGTVIVNSPQSVLNTYRYRMVPLLSDSGISFPKSKLVSTDDLSFVQSQPAEPFKKIWVKRGDVHNTQKGDVSSAESAEEARRSLHSFHSREIQRAVLQEDIPGDLIKFYGVGQGSESSKESSWFKWFYHKNQDLKRYPFSEPLLKQCAQRAAVKLGLEVFGGDVVVTAEGMIFLIDLNAWPSFALFREEVSPIIVDYLMRKFATVENKVCPPSLE